MKEFGFTIPAWMAKASEKVGDWVNVPVYKWGDGHEVRRVDVLLVLGGVLNFAWGYYTYGFFAGVKTVVAYIFVALVALWFL